MDLWDRILWLAIGGSVGFVLGYIVRALRDIEEKVDHVEHVVDKDTKPSKWQRREGGFLQRPKAKDVALLLVIIVTAWASFATAHVNSQLNRTVTCLTEYNLHQSSALKTRDHSIKEGTQSEITLWTEYGQLYAQAQSDPTKIPLLQRKLNEAIHAHRTSLENLQETRDNYPYPNPNILKNCKENPT